MDRIIDIIIDILIIFILIYDGIKIRRLQETIDELYDEIDCLTEDVIKLEENKKK